MIFVVGMVGSLCYCRADNPQLQWWLRSVLVFCSRIVWRWISVNEENWQWRSYPLSTFATILIIGAFLPVILVVGMLGSLCYCRGDNYRLQRWLRAVSVFHSGIVLDLLTCRRWNCVNEENWKWRYYFIYTFTTILTIGAFLLVTFVLAVLGMVASLCYQRADNPRLWWWLSLVSVSCSGVVFCLSTCRRWNSVNEENWQWRYYLVSTFTTSFTNGAFLLATFVLGMVGSSCYWRADESWLHWWLRSVSVSCSGIVFCLPICRRWNCVNMENWHWWYYVISTSTTLLTTEVIPLATFALGMVGS